MTREIKAGSTDISVDVFIADSSVTTGAGKTGLAYNTASLICYYKLNRGAPVQITLATLAANNSAHADGGFKEIDASTMPGWYRLDLPDAAVASAGPLGIHLSGAANMVPTPLLIDVKANLTSDVITATTAIETDTQDIQARIPAALVSGRIDASVGAMANNVMTAAAAASDLTTELQSGLATASAISTLDGKVDTVDTVVDAIKAKTDNLPSDPADQSILVGRFDTLDTNLATVDTVVDAIKLKTDNLPSDPADQSLLIARFDTLDTNLATVDTVADAIKVKTDNLPSDPADHSVIIDATNAILSAVGTVDTVVDGIAVSVATVDTVADAIKVVTDKLDTALEADGGVYRYTTNALEQAPSGGTGLDAAGVRAAIGMASANLDTQLSTIDTVADAIKAKTDNLPSDPADASVIAGRFDTLDTNLAVVDGVADAIKAKTDNLPSDPADQSLIIAATDAISSALVTVDTVVDAIKLKTDNLPSDPADHSVIIDATNAILSAVSTVDTVVDGIALSVATVDTVVDGIAVSVATVDTVVDAIKLKTDNLPSDPADASVIAARFDTLDSAVSNVPTNAEFEARTILAGDYATGAALATVDTVADAIKAKTDALPAAPAAVSDIPTANQNADALLDRANGVETGLTPRQWMRITGAALAGEVSGAAGSSIVFRNIGDTKNRITATVDGDGNRTNVTTDGT